MLFAKELAAPVPIHWRATRLNVGGVNHLLDWWHAIKWDDHVDCPVLFVLSVVWIGSGPREGLYTYAASWYVILPLFLRISSPIALIPSYR